MASVRIRVEQQVARIKEVASGDVGRIILRRSRVSFKISANFRNLRDNYAAQAVSLIRSQRIMVYIRLDKLHNLKQYKYAGVDHSLLSRYVLKPFYTNVAIKFFPMSMA